MNNDMKKVIQESMLKVIEMIVAENNVCQDCPLAKAIVNQLPNQIIQDLYRH